LTMYSDDHGTTLDNKFEIAVNNHQQFATGSFNSKILTFDVKTGL
jgi:hypothetical protein